MSRPYDQLNSHEREAVDSGYRALCQMLKDSGIEIPDDQTIPNRMIVDCNKRMVDAIANAVIAGRKTDWPKSDGLIVVQSMHLALVCYPNGQHRVEDTRNELRGPWVGDDVVATLTAEPANLLNYWNTPV